MPTLTVFAGPNGSGKSTIARSLDFEGRERLLDPDAVAAWMSAGGERRAAVAAGREVLRRTRDYLALGLSFGVETTLAGNGPLETIRGALRRGFRVDLIYVALNSAERNVLRVQERVARGGHDVPDEDIRRRYARSLANFPVALQLATRAVVYDNSDREWRKVLETQCGGVVWVSQRVPEWASDAVRIAGLV